MCPMRLQYCNYYPWTVSIRRFFVLWLIGTVNFRIQVTWKLYGQYESWTGRNMTKREFGLFKVGVFYCYPLCCRNWDNITTAQLNNNSLKNEQMKMMNSKKIRKKKEKERKSTTLKFIEEQNMYIYSFFCT